MRKISVKLSEKVYYMSSVLNMGISDLIRESLNYVSPQNYSIRDVITNSIFKDCFHKRNTSVLITRENEALLEYVSSKYHVSKEGFINSAVDLYCAMQIRLKSEVKNN